MTEILEINKIINICNNNNEDKIVLTNYHKIIILEQNQEPVASVTNLVTKNNNVQNYNNKNNIKIKIIEF